jgi:hypothetical protein
MAPHRPPADAKPKNVGPEYIVVIERLGDKGLFEARHATGRWRLAINRDHPFFRKVYVPLRRPDMEAARGQMERLLQAYAKAAACQPPRRCDPAALRAGWADALAALLEGPG